MKVAVPSVEAAAAAARCLPGMEAAVPTVAPDGVQATFTAIGRLFHACSAGWPLDGAAEDAVGARAPCSRGAAITLSDLTDGPYFGIVACLGVGDLFRADACCRLTRDLNRRHRGPWWALGHRLFEGIELSGDVTFDAAPEADEVNPAASEGRRLCKALDPNWKRRCLHFMSEVLLFRSPFFGRSIFWVGEADEVAYYGITLRTDLLGEGTGSGVYLEAEVTGNPDNVSLAVVDFEAGGISSMTFSPDTGAVIRERKVREMPRKAEGTFIHPLGILSHGEPFEGSIALYVHDGRMAFFRRATRGSWECTGYVADFSWAEGQRLSPCLAFRDPGSYRIRNTRVGGPPPVAVRPGLVPESEWKSLDWDAMDVDAAPAGVSDGEGGDE